MFRHKNGLLIPQSEHLRISGSIALLYGNKEFEKPFNYEVWLQSIAVHDKIFGICDTYLLSEISSLKREEQVNNWINSEYNSVEEKLIILFHVRRILKDNNLQVSKLVDKEIKEISKNNNLELEKYQKIDSITDLCDLASFLFCFGDRKTTSLNVFKNEKETIKVEIQIQDEQIILDPWPLSVEKYEGYILGYKTKEDLKNFNPQIIKYIICQKN